MRKKVSMRVKVSMVYRHYQALWTEQYGTGYDRRFAGIDRTLTTAVLQRLSAAEIKRRIENFFGDDGQWLRDHSHPYRIFITRVGEYARARRNGRHGSDQDCRFVERERFDVEREFARWHRPAGGDAQA